MHRKAHEKSCRKFFGRSFSNAHRFLDQFAEPGNPVHTHRHILHHQRGVEIIVREFGEEARCPAILHILEDKLTHDGIEIIRDWDDWDWIFFRGDKEKEEQAVLLKRFYLDYQP